MRSARFYAQVCAGDAVLDHLEHVALWVGEVEDNAARDVVIFARDASTAVRHPFSRCPDVLDP